MEARYQQSLRLHAKTLFLLEIAQQTLKRGHSVQYGASGYLVLVGFRARSGARAADWMA
jgi:hypothetical protein